MHLEVLFVARCQDFIFEQVGRDKAIAQIMLDRYLVKRFITVEGVADLIAFLFGPSATSITGCNWIMDGGLTSQ